MEKSKIFLVFDTFSNQEIKEFRKFVNSPFFNQQKEISLLLDFLVECKQHLKVIPTKEKAFQFVFGQQKFSDVKVRLLMSDMYKLIEKFLICKNTFADDIQNKIQLASTYRQRNLPKHFEKTIKRSDELLEKGNLRHAEYFNSRYKQLVEEYQFASSQKRNEEFNLQEISDTLDITFVTMKLRQTCLLLSHQTVYKKEYDFGLLSLIIQYIEQNNLLETPAISMYYYCYKALTEPQYLEYFTNFKPVSYTHLTLPTICSV